MTIPLAVADTVALEPLERSRYDFRQLSHAVAVAERSEKLVGETQLARHFKIEPFWSTPGDLEGDAHREYMNDHPEFELMVRRGVYERLVQVQQLLPSSWQLVLKAGYRPLSVQLKLLDVFANESRQRHPRRTEEEHLTHARTFVSDPQLVVPPHVTGGAVDVDVRDRDTGAYIDMGCPPNTDSEVSYLHTDFITPEQYGSRLVLLKAMLAAGFAPNPHEWWHYQYGETIWAAFYSHSAAPYGLQGD